MTTLYEQLGDENLSILVDSFYELVYADNRISHLFKTEQSLIKEKQFQFLSQFLGGPPRYSEVYGHPRMRMRHISHQITEAHAIAWLENMAMAISKLDIEEALKEELFNRFPQVAAHMITS